MKGGWALALAGVLLSGCGAHPGEPPVARPVDRVSQAGSTGGDPYVRLATALHDRGVQVWFESDLVGAWLAGHTTFETVVERLGRLADVPGVVGFKIADELGYQDGLTSPAEAMAFLQAAHTALARVAPHAEILIDMVVPQLGCLPSYDAAGRSCAAAAGAAAPAAAIDAVSAYLRTGWVDRLDLSTGLLDSASYAARGLDLRSAQRQAWAEVGRLGWASLTTLQARKALAAAGGFQGTATEAAEDLAVYVDLPTAAGAHAVDIWTWRQPYEGSTVGLLAPSLAPNPLWIGLRRLRARHVSLLTHMTPSQMPTDPAGFAHECDLAASVFSAVFVAAGTG